MPTGYKPMRGKSHFVFARLYGPLEPWFNGAGNRYLVD